MSSYEWWLARGHTTIVNPSRALTVQMLLAHQHEVDLQLFASRGGLILPDNDDKATFEKQPHH